MSRLNLKGLIGFAVAIATAAITSQAEAGFHHHRSPWLGMELWQLRQLWLRLVWFERRQLRLVGQQWLVRQLRFVGLVGRLW